ILDLPASTISPPIRFRLSDCLAHSPTGDRESATTNPPSHDTTAGALDNARSDPHRSHQSHLPQTTSKFNGDGHTATVSRSNLRTFCEGFCATTGSPSEAGVF